MSKVYEPFSPTSSAQRSTEYSGTCGSALQTLLVILAALAIATAAIASYLYFSPRPAVPLGSVEQIWVYPIHHENPIGGGMGQTAAVKQPFDQVIVLAKIKIDNPGKIPVFIHDMSASLALPNTDPLVSPAAAAGDFNRVFAAYSELAPNKQAPLLRETSIAPGTSTEGLAVFSYPIAKEQWDTHTALDVTISFVHQADLVLKAPQS